MSVMNYGVASMFQDTDGREATEAVEAVEATETASTEQAGEAAASAPDTEKEEAPKNPQHELYEQLVAQAAKFSHIDLGVILLQQNQALLQFSRQLAEQGRVINDLSHAIIRLEGHSYSALKTLIADGTLNWDAVRNASAQLAEPGVPLYKFLGLTAEQYTGKPEEEAPVQEEAPAQEETTAQAQEAAEDVEE